jgi:hypothetical protein
MTNIEEAGVTATIAKYERKALQMEAERDAARAQVAHLKDTLSEVAGKLLTSPVFSQSPSTAYELAKACMDACA